MTAFDDLVADLHADEDLATAAQFRRPPHGWAAVRVIVSQPTDALGQARAGSLAADLIASAITDTPQPGDELRIDGTVYVVDDTERDALGLSWRLTLSDRN